MRAVIADHPGAPDVLHPVTLPDPDPGPEQVRVAVETAAITFIDTLIRSGSPVAPPATFPVVLGNGVGGIVDRVGPGGGPGLDRRPCGHHHRRHRRLRQPRAGPHRRPAPRARTARLPEATALLADGRTAVGLHHAASIRPGDTVVITAAAGGVGSILVQLAKASGAHVIALAGSTDKLDHARSLGADTAVSYRDHDWTSRVHTAAADGVDVVLDGIGAETTPALFALVRPGGRYVQHGAAGGSWGTIDPAAAATRGVTVIPLSAIGDTAEKLFSLTEQALDLAAEGRIHPTIGQTFPLDAAAAAHTAIESRATIGKTLLLP